MTELTRDQAVALAGSGFWKQMTDRQIAEFQLFESRLCMPFDVFHVAVEKTLGRSVWTHEFAQPELLRKELLGERVAPTFEEILGLIPEHVRLTILVTP